MANWTPQGSASLTLAMELYSSSELYKYLTIQSLFPPNKHAELAINFAEEVVNEDFHGRPKGISGRWNIEEKKYCLSLSFFFFSLFFLCLPIA